MLFTGTLWCGRIYRALLHQAATNKHRALSLQTFRAFVEATEDENVKDAVLLSATRAIFASIPTGFVDQKAVPDDSSIKVVELAKTAGKNLANPSED